MIIPVNGLFVWFFVIEKLIIGKLKKQINYER